MKKVIILNIQNLNPIQSEELTSIYQEKVAQLSFQVLKLRRGLAKRLQQEYKWEQDLAKYQKRKEEGSTACLVLSESNPFYHKIHLDVQKCEIKIMELEIRLQRFKAVQKVEKISKIMALEASIQYYQSLIVDLETLFNAPKPQFITHWLVDRPLQYQFFGPLDYFSISAVNESYCSTQNLINTDKSDKPLKTVA